MDAPKLTREHREHKSTHDKFLEDHRELFDTMSGLLGELAPGVFKEFQRYPLLPKEKRGSGAWSACVVNDGGNDPNQTEVHRDVKESQYGYSCVVSCGDFIGGAMILYDLEYILEMEAGDLLLFPDSLIHHSNEPAQGTRKSIVTFTQENMNDYWHRKYNMTLKRHVAKERWKLKAKEQKKAKVSRAEKMKAKVKKRVVELIDI
jgi:hypothetical protein